jgi:predicted TIM-barrel fold metal-dependent hydrolase
MVATHATRSAEIRARLSYPVIDCDGHYLEMRPRMVDYVRQVGGAQMAERFVRGGEVTRYFEDPITPQERREKGDFAWPCWWATTSRNTLDRATAIAPRLLAERLDDMGLDYTVLFNGLMLPHIEQDEERRVYIRAFNLCQADLFRDHADRMTAAAVIPMHTPQEAIAELEFVVNTLGTKAIMIATYVRRPVKALLASHPQLAYQAGTLDTYGLDSDYDYDPFWAKCVELKVVPCTHSTGMGWGSRRSYTNFMHNHIGHFAAASEALARNLVLGGVTRRFPKLKVGFLECGVAWAVSLYSDMIAHWDKRNPARMPDFNPASVDIPLMMGLLERYEYPDIARLGPEIRALHERPEAPPPVDDWAATGVERAEDFRGLFEPHFYFGCEADDPLNAWAFNTKVNPFGARMRTLLSSDISHWDMPDMTEVLEEAYELLEHELVTPDQMRQFLFANAVEMYGTTNPDFFKGTRVEAAVNAELRRSDGAA